MTEIMKQENGFVNDIKQIIVTSRNQAARSVDFCRVQMYWNIGRRIFEEEQQGKDRADYGSYLIKGLSKQLVFEYGSSFGMRSLEPCCLIASQFTSLGFLSICIFLWKDFGSHLISSLFLLQHACYSLKMLVGSQ